MQSTAQPPNLQPVMAQIERVIEAQFQMQKSIALMQDSISSLQIGKPAKKVEALSPKRNKVAQVRAASDLKKLFDVAEKESERQRLEKQKSLCQRHFRDTVMELEVLDIFAVIVIIANTIFMGVRLDMDGDHWVPVDTTITCLFVLELVLRVSIKGVKTQFCGEDRFPRLFDAFIIVADVTQVCLDLFVDTTIGGGISVSLFRIVRLSRFSRLIRLSHLQFFQDLLAMLQGIVGGARTLAWATFLFAIVTYIAALLCREAFGRTDKEHVAGYFDSVPRAMFTVFRCSFGDCTSADGVPIFEHVSDAFGGYYLAVYVVYTFSLWMGFFNVIQAIFVDGAMSAAANVQEKRQYERLSSETRMATNVATIIKQVLLAAGKSTKDYSMGDNIEDYLMIGELEVDRKYIDQLASEKVSVQDPVVIRALDALDIDRHDHSKLSDILDPDHGGTITITELVSGLLALRGQPRRSDIVSINLMIRSMQDQLDQLCDKHKHR